MSAHIGVCLFCHQTQKAVVCNDPWSFNCRVSILSGSVVLQTDAFTRWWHIIKFLLFWACSVVQASKIWRFVAFLCYVYVIVSWTFWTFWIMDCRSNKISNLDTFLWAVRNYGQHFSPLANILKTKHLINQLRNNWQVNQYWNNCKLPPYKWLYFDLIH